MTGRSVEFCKWCEKCGGYHKPSFGCKGSWKRGMARVLSYFRFLVWRMRVKIWFAKTGNCGLACDWVEPYGFVPEADCPIHDVSDECFWQMPNWVHEATLDQCGCHLAVTKAGELVWLQQYEYLERDDISCAKVI